MRQPFYNKRVGCWYVWHQGKQHRLAARKSEAIALWKQMGDEPAGTCARDILTLYLSWVKANRSERTYDRTSDYITSFMDLHGAVLSVRKHHVTSWLAGQPTWGQTTQCHAIRRLKTAFSWAASEGHIEANPIAHVKAPAATRREHAITPEQHEMVMGHVLEKSFRHYLTFLYETGCRPEEIRKLRREHVQENQVVLPPSLGKGKRGRIILMTQTATGLVESLPNTGFLFVNSAGKPWTKNSVNCRMRRLKRKTGISGLCATSWRHGFATEALKRGVDPVTVSVLMGHKDTSMVSRTYQHLAGDTEHLQSSLQRIFRK